MDHPKTMQGETMTTAQAVAAIERIIVAAVTLCDGLVRAVGEMKREREALQKTIGQMEHEANTQHAAALDLQAQRDAAQEKLAEYEGENKRWHSFETVQAIVKERDGANRALNTVLQKLRAAIENQPQALPGSPDLVDELIAQRDAATNRAEQAKADARRLAHIAKHVRIVSESENNLIEKYLNSKRA